MLSMTASTTSQNPTKKNTAQSLESQFFFPKTIFLLFSQQQKNGKCLFFKCKFHSFFYFWGKFWYHKNWQRKPSWEYWKCFHLILNQSCWIWRSLVSQADLLWIFSKLMNVQCTCLWWVFLAQDPSTTYGKQTFNFSLLPTI